MIRSIFMNIYIISLGILIDSIVFKKMQCMHNAREKKKLTHYNLLPMNSYLYGFRYADMFFEYTYMYM